MYHTLMHPVIPVHAGNRDSERLHLSLAIASGGAEQPSRLDRRPEAPCRYWRRPPALQQRVRVEDN